MEKSLLEELINEGLSSRKIAKEIDMSQGNVMHWLRKYNLKTKIVKKPKLVDPNRFICKYCGKKLGNGYQRAAHQIHCDQNPQKDEIRSKITAAAKGRKLSEEHKKKISKARIKYLKANPDKVPYLMNHSSKMSYPELLFAQALTEEEIVGWEYAYRNGIYEYDFAWPEIKLDVEIDGSTHLLENVKEIDRKRDEWSREQGWTVLRFTDKEVKENIMKIISQIVKQLK
jgi:very-short-patch-repair endonuclease/predicted transcriptional regulator